jgi:UDP-glucose 4-epimerase
MSKIVITGGAGFIGSHIAEELALMDHEVVIIDNLDDYYSPDLKRRNLKLLLANPNVRFIEGDITDSDLLRRVIDSDVEFVFHEAAQAGVRISVEDPFKPKHRRR